MKLSDNGFDFIAKFEGLYLHSYDDLQPKLTLTSSTRIKGTLTIGIGHTGYVNGKKISYNTTITKLQAKQLFLEDISEKIDILNKIVTAPVSQNMADALISITYNCGQNNTYVQQAISHINSYDYISASLDIKNGTVTSKGVKLQGLIKRRQAEYELFIKDIENITTKDGDDIMNYVTIKKGDTGVAVRIWQAIINTTVDGVFGSKTQQATKLYQQQANLNVDGIVGNNTWQYAIKHTLKLK